MGSLLGRTSQPDEVGILHEMRDSGDPFVEELIRDTERERLAKAEELLRQKRPPEQELDQSL
jgi:hypothetical protein